MSTPRLRFPHRSRPVAGFAVLVAGLLLTGCGSDSQADSAGSGQTSPRSSDEGDHSGGEHAGMDMGNMEMDSSGAEPSETAAMICSDEVSDSVVRTLALDQAPPTSDTWSDLVYTCRYTLPEGDLVLSVKDSADDKSGMAYFEQLRGELDDSVGVTPIKGLEALGLPSYESKVGDIVFIKDGKTLHVDASNLSADAAQDTETRTDVAYQIATDVIACWSE